ncbi:hypothetical protein SBA4_3150037 [Candidatus Sulfopaludibacter sp. SbA4]|nr:hypothetical protein SBA4_3150037 [Candidatus Sulfopaludibacter sp. SbA4]
MGEDFYGWLEKRRGSGVLRDFLKSEMRQADAAKIMQNAAEESAGRPAAGAGEVWYD